ncbi:trace amine-associated receptor 13c-like [Epinephelus fuscoguttatus]|uniref:trace amine-associated receptor 13c-like n=1 Tax=Epinephelus fuscoguttatus TaxID=293821 RepID=UPI0020D0D84C|nr:trace amine-associated receptor 13c-like [Epinephelus fuscoguttatus]
MTLGLSQEQYCFPGSNTSCIKAPFSVGTKLALYLLFVLGMLITILGNSVVIVSISHFKELHNPTNVLIVSLALVDLLVGVIVMPFSTIRTIHGCWFYGDDFCLLHSSFDMFLTTLSILHLICIAVDRKQAICNPLHYSRNITMPVAWVMVCACWALAAVYSFGLLYSKANIAGLEDYLASLNCLGSCNLLFNHLWGVLDSVISFFFPCTVMVCLYTKVFIVAKGHVRKIGDMSNCSKRREQEQDRAKGGLIKQSEHKAAKTLGIVVGAFIFCWMPFFINSAIDAYTAFSTPTAIFETFVWLGYFNSTLNPIIYAFFYPSFKRCFYCIVTLKIFASNSSTMTLSVK